MPKPRTIPPDVSLVNRFNTVTNAVNESIQAHVAARHELLVRADQLQRQAEDCRRQADQLAGSITALTQVRKLLTTPSAPE